MKHDFYQLMRVCLSSIPPRTVMQTTSSTRFTLKFISFFFVVILKFVLVLIIFKYFEKIIVCFEKSCRGTRFKFHGVPVWCPWETLRLRVSLNTQIGQAAIFSQANTFCANFLFRGRKRRAVSRRRIFFTPVSFSRFDSTGYRKVLKVFKAKHIGPVFTSPKFFSRGLRMISITLSTKIFRKRRKIIIILSAREYCVI